MMNDEGSGPKIKIGIALSGGPDSLGLLALAKAWAEASTEPKKGTSPRDAKNAKNAQLVALVVDHQLRADSSQEAMLVAQRAREFGVDAHVLTWERPMADGGDLSGLKGKQRAARWARYALLADAAKRLGLDRVWVGHNAQDQAESVCMRWTKGSGVWGLAGLSAQFALFDVLFERPVLGMPHSLLDSAACQHFGAEVVVRDPSNLDVNSWRGAARLAYGRGVAGMPLAPDLMAAAQDFGRWRRSVELKRRDLRAPALRARNLSDQPLACAAWIRHHAQVLTQREHAMGFDRAVQLIIGMRNDLGVGAARHARTQSGVILIPFKSAGGEKCWTVEVESDPRRTKQPDSQTNPNRFWRRLFKNPSSLSHQNAFTPTQPLFAIASERFATTLDA